MEAYLYFFVFCCLSLPLSTERVPSERKVPPRRRLFPPVRPPVSFALLFFKQSLPLFTEKGACFPPPGSVARVPTPPFRLGCGSLHRSFCYFPSFGFPLFLPMTRFFHFFFSDMFPLSPPPPRLDPPSIFSTITLAGGFP